MSSPIFPRAVALPWGEQSTYDDTRFREAFHNAGALEIRTDADGRPRLMMWKEGLPLDGLNIWDRKQAHFIRIVRVRVYPAPTPGGLPSLLIQYRYNHDTYATVSGQRVRVTSEGDEAYVKRALSIFGEAVACAYCGDSKPWIFTFWDYDARRVNDPVAGATLMRTALWQDRRVLSFEERFQVSATAVCTVPAKTGYQLAVFGVSDSSRTTKLVTLDQRLNPLRADQLSGLVFAATAQQNTFGGHLMYAAEHDDGSIALHETACDSVSAPDLVTAGDLSDVYGLVRCFDHFVLLKRGGRVMHLKPGVRPHHYTQSVIFTVLPNVIPREFHAEDRGGRLVLDAQDGMLLSAPIHEVREDDTATLRGVDPNATMPA